MTLSTGTKLGPCEIRSQVEQLNKALDLQPDLRNAATELMWVHLGMGDHAAAAASFENNLTLLGQPASPE